MNAVLHDHKTPEWYLDCNLDNWARYMQGMCKPDALPDHACGIGVSSATSFDDLMDACNLRLAKITEAVICDLPTIEQQIIHYQYLGATFRFSYDDFDKSLADAKVKIQAGLKRRGVWLGE